MEKSERLAGVCVLCTAIEYKKRPTEYLSIPPAFKPKGEHRPVWSQIVPELGRKKEGLVRSTRKRT